MTPHSASPVHWFGDSRRQGPPAGPAETAPPDAVANQVSVIDQHSGYPHAPADGPAGFAAYGRSGEYPYPYPPERGAASGYDREVVPAYERGAVPAYERGAVPAYERGAVATTDGPYREEALDAYRENAPTAVRPQLPDELAASGSERATPRPRGYGWRKVLVVALFWAAFVATLAIWWFNTPLAGLSTRTGVFLAAGRIMGLMSTFVLLVEVLTMARLRWVESWFGAYGVQGWHRALGGALVALVVAHVVLVVLAYSWVAKRPPLDQGASMIDTLPYLTSAAVAAALLVVVGLLSVRFVRRWLPYQLWHLLHLSMYVVLFLAYGHQFALGSALLRAGWARWYWIGLHVFVLACLLWGRVLRPFWFNARHVFWVAAVVDDAPGWISIYIGGRRMEWVHAEVGQYVRCRFLDDRFWWQSHPFSIAETSDGRWLRLRVKTVGRYTRALRHLEPGVGVLLWEASGEFTVDRRTTDRALIIAGGNEIALATSLLAELPTGTVLLCRALGDSDLVFGDELERVAREREATIFFVAGSRDGHWPRRAFSPPGLRELVPDVAERDVYVCGPRPMVKQSVNVLRWLRVPHRQIHCESFEL